MTPNWVVKENTMKILTTIKNDFITPYNVRVAQQVWKWLKRVTLIVTLIVVGAILCTAALTDHPLIAFLLAYVAAGLASLAVSLGILYLLVRFIKWAWTN